MKQKIYIIHGWAYDTKKWQPFLDSLEKAGGEVKMLSVPGLTSPLETVWHLEDYVAWLYTMLQKEKEPVILLGHSNGGRISLAFSLQYPKKVARLILIDSAGIYHNEWSIRMKRIVFRTLAKVGRRFSESPFLRDMLYRFAREKDYKEASPVVRKTMSNLIAVDLTPRLSQLVVPTLLIWGKEDTITPLVDGKVMEKEIPGAVLQIIAGARHSPQFTHVKLVVDMIVKDLEVKR